MISKPSAYHSVASSTRGGIARRRRLRELEHDLRLDLRREHRRDGQRRVVPVGVAHGVVVHVRPHQRLELERAPHRLVGVADLPADGLVAAGPPRPRDLGFDGVRGRRDRSRRRATRARRRSVCVRVRVASVRWARAFGSHATVIFAISWLPAYFAVAGTPTAIALGARDARRLNAMTDGDERQHRAAVEARRPAAEPLEQQRARRRRR